MCCNVPICIYSISSAAGFAVVNTIREVVKRWMDEAEENYQGTSDFSEEKYTRLVVMFTDYLKRSGIIKDAEEWTGKVTGLLKREEKRNIMFPSLLPHRIWRHILAKMLLVLSPKIQLKGASGRL